MFICLEMVPACDRWQLAAYGALLLVQFRTIYFVLLLLIITIKALNIRRLKMSFTAAGSTFSTAMQEVL